MLPDSQCSVLAGEGQGLSQSVSESLFSGQGLLEVQEEVLGVSSRLRSAVDGLLDLLQVGRRARRPGREDHGKRMEPD